jgi:ATP-dependent DNA ligase
MQTMVNIAPMTCNAIMTAPIGGDWFIEPKLDGARILAHVHEDRVEFQTRTSKSQTGKFPEIEEALLNVFPADSIVDGEFVAFQEGSQANDWGAVQSAIGSSRPNAAQRARVHYAVFDVLRLDGNETAQLAYSDRRLVLADKLKDDNGMRLIRVPSFEVESREEGETLHELILHNGYEGSVWKKGRSSYSYGTRSRLWQKWKPQQDADVLITGFEVGNGKFAGMIGAVRFVHGDAEGKCSGMSDRVRQDMTDNPDAYVGRIMEIRHHGAMPSGKLRHPQFVRMRESFDAELDQV